MSVREFVAYMGADARRFRAEAMKLIDPNFGAPKCRCCVELNGSMLTIDHIFGDGVQHRESFSRLEDYYWDILTELGCNGELYRAAPIRRWRFRILCYNCNRSSFARGGVCEHLDLDPSAMALRAFSRMYHQDVAFDLMWAVAFVLNERERPLPACDPAILRQSAGLANLVLDCDPGDLEQCAERDFPDLIARSRAAISGVTNMIDGPAWWQTSR